MRSLMLPSKAVLPDGAGGKVVLAASLAVDLGAVFCVLVTRSHPINACRPPLRGGELSFVCKISPAAAGLQQTAIYEIGWRNSEALVEKPERSGMGAGKEIFQVNQDRAGSHD